MIFSSFKHVKPKDDRSRPSMTHWLSYQIQIQQMGVNIHVGNQKEKFSTYSPRFSPTIICSNKTQSVDDKDTCKPEDPLNVTITMTPRHLPDETKVVGYWRYSYYPYRKDDILLHVSRYESHNNNPRTDHHDCYCTQQGYSALSFVIVIIAPAPVWLDHPDMWDIGLKYTIKPRVHQLRYINK